MTDDEHECGDCENHYRHIYTHTLLGFHVSWGHSIEKKMFLYCTNCIFYQPRI